MFIDQIKVYARAGHGGKGCVAFHREAYITKGGPSGGNGGRGGNVILQADHDLNNLIGQYFVPRLIAQVGEAGMGKGMDGHAGKDLLIKVPGADAGLEIAFRPVPESRKRKRRARSRNRTKQCPALGCKNAPSSAIPAKRTRAGNQSRSKAERTQRAPRLQHEAVNWWRTSPWTGSNLCSCKGGRGGLGNRNFATARHRQRQAQHPASRATKGNFVLNCG